MAGPLGSGGTLVNTGGGPGVGGGGTGASPGAGGMPVSGAGGTSSQDPSTPLLARAWRLTHEQYRRSVSDLVGVEPDLGNFAPESGNGRYTNFSTTSFVQVDLAQNYFDVARSLADQLTVTQLGALTSCQLQAPCRDAYIQELGERAFRAPVPSEVSARLASVFDLASGEADFEAGFRAVLVAVLNSPLFLYRKELGPPEQAAAPTVSLTAAEVAEFLAFSLLDGPPPAWLREQARTGLTAANVESVMEKLLAEPAFQQTVARFLSEWLEVDHFDAVEKSDVFPGFAEAKPLMKQELVSFFAQSGQASSGLGNLLLDSVPSVSEDLDAFYLSDPSAPPSGARTGILGLGAVLSSHAKTYLTSPTLRGKFVQGRLFCREITLPEGFTPPPLSETESLGIAKTTRELYEKHQTDPVCAECHRMTDNIGFVLESFDGAGRFRTADSTQGMTMPLNLAAALTDSDVDRPLSGPEDLSRALSESQQVRHCFARQAFRFYFGQVEGSSELPAVLSGNGRLGSAGALKDMLMGLISTDNTFARQRGGN